MRSFKFLKDDMTSGHGSEKAWTVGEGRTFDGEIRICESGYHSSPSWYDALGFAAGSMACVVEISEPEAREADKYVSRTIKILAAVNVEKELRLWGVDCARRALERERAAGREPDPRSWAALDVAVRFARGEATADELAAAGAAAWAAAGDAARAAAWAAARDAAGDAARDAARDAAGDAARDAARAAEIDWQRDELNRRLDAVFAAVSA